MNCGNIIDSKATRKSTFHPNINGMLSEWVIIPAAASEMTPNWHDRDLTWEWKSEGLDDDENWTITEHRQ